MVANSIFVYDLGTLRALFTNFGVQESRYSRWWSNDLRSRKEQETFFDSRSHDNLLLLFREHQCPVFMQYEKGLVVNPKPLSSQ